MVAVDLSNNTESTVFADTKQIAISDRDDNDIFAIKSLGNTFDIVKYDRNLNIIYLNSNLEGEIQKLIIINKTIQL